MKPSRAKARAKRLREWGEYLRRHDYLNPPPRKPRKKPKGKKG